VEVTPEGKVKKMVKKALDTLGADCWRFMPVQTGFGSPALDYLLSIRGRFVAIETKAPGKTLTPLQEGTKAAIEAAGGIVLVVWDEGSLAIALKILLAMEFAPNAPTINNKFGSLSQCLKYGKGDYTGKIEAKRIDNPKVQGESDQLLRSLYHSAATYQAVGRDHGAPPNPPKR
jgi:hypothetical protein